MTIKTAFVAVALLFTSETTLDVWGSSLQTRSFSMLASDFYPGSTTLFRGTKTVSPELQARISEICAGVSAKASAEAIGINTFALEVICLTFRIKDSSREVRYLNIGCFSHAFWNMTTFPANERTEKVFGDLDFDPFDPFAPECETIRDLIADRKAEDFVQFNKYCDKKYDKPVYEKIMKKLLNARTPVSDAFVYWFICKNAEDKFSFIPKADSEISHLMLEIFKFMDLYKLGKPHNYFFEGPVNSEKMNFMLSVLNDHAATQRPLGILSISNFEMDGRATESLCNLLTLNPPTELHLRTSSMDIGRGNVFRALNGVKKIKCYNTCFTAETIEAFCNALASNDTITGMDIGECYLPERKLLTPKLLGMFANALRLNKSVVDICLGNCVKADARSRAGVSATAEVIRALNTNPNSRCWTLNLWGNRIDRAAAEEIAALLKNNKISGILDLSNCFFSSGVATMLFEGLEANHTLTGINLTRYPLNPEEKTALATALQNNDTITYLALEQCELGDMGIELLANSLMNRKPPIGFFNVSCNMMKDKGASVIARLVNDGIVNGTLDVGYNWIGKAGLEAIADAAGNNSDLHSLLIRDQRNPQLKRRITDDITKRFDEAKKKNKSLEVKLDLD